MADWSLFESTKAGSDTDATIFQQIRSEPVNLGSGHAQVHDGPIEYSTKNMSAWYNLNDAYIEVVFEIALSGGGAAAATDFATLQNSAWSLFERAELYIGPSEPVDVVDNPAFVHIMYALSRYSPSRLSEVADQEWLYFDEPNIKFGGVDPDAVAPQTKTSLMGFAQQVNPVGFITTGGAAGAGGDNLKRAARFSQSFAKRLSRSQGSAPIRVMLPLRSIFGFCDNISQPIRGTEIRVVLNRKSNNYPEIMQSAFGANPCKPIVLSSSLWIPQVVPTPEIDARLSAQLSSNLSAVREFENRTCYFSPVYPVGSAANEILNIEFRVATLASRPTLVFVGFQHSNQFSAGTDKTAATGAITAGYAGARTQLDICDGALFSALNDIYKVELRVNSDRYPNEPYNMTFADESYERAYRDFLAIFFKDHPENSKIVTQEAYRHSPIFAYKIDNSDALYDKVKTVNLDLRATVVHDNVDTTTRAGRFRAVCVVFSDRNITISAVDGRTVISS